MFAAVALMPVADATAISFLNPALAVLLAVVFLGESLTARKVIACVLSLSGAVLILRPGGEAFQPAAFLALAAAGFMAVEIILIKRLSDTEPPTRILLINNAIGAVISVSVAFFFWSAPTPMQWSLLIGVGVVMVSAQGLFLQAMTRSEASFVSPVFYSVLIFAAMLDFLIYAVAPTVFTLVGSALILAGAVLLGMQRSGGGRIH